MRSLIVFALVATGVLLTGCVQNSYRSKSYDTQAYRAAPSAMPAAAAASVSRSEPTEVTYVSKPAPDQRRNAFPAPPPPALPDGITAADVAGTPCAPCDPCKPRCNPFSRLFCNPCCPPGG